LAGGKITGWKSSLYDIKNSGEQIIDQEVVEGSNFISSRSTADILAFVKA